MKNPLNKIFGKKEMSPEIVHGTAGIRDMTYQSDNAGNHFYLFDTEYAKANFTEIKMNTIAGKTQALAVCTPFAAMVDRMGKLFAAGVDYVTDLENNENFESPLQDKIRQLIKRPNPFQTATMFKRQVETYLLVYGFCPIFGFRMSPIDVPATLWCIPPELFHAKMTGNFLMQTDYSEIVSEAWVQIAHKRMPLMPEDYFMVFSGQVNMGENNELKVYTPADTLSVSLNNWLNQNIARGAVIKDGGPKGILTNDDNSEFGNFAMTQKEQERLNNAFKAKYGWVNKDFKVLVSQAALKWQAMSWNAKELLLDETKSEVMKDICFALGWSYGLFDPSSQYSNNVAGEEKRTYVTVIIPDSETYTEALTRFLNQPNIKYYIDYTGVEALQKDRKAEAQTLNTIINALNLGIQSNMMSKLECRTILSEYVDIDPNENGEINQEKSIRID